MTLVDLAEYLAVQWIPSQMQEGRESPWLRAGELHLASADLWIGDPSLALTSREGLSIVVRPDRYAVDIRIIDYGLDRRVSRLRVSSAASQRRSRPVSYGLAWTDTALVGVISQPIPEGPRTPAKQEGLDVALAAIDFFAMVDVDGAGSATMAVSASGFGDGEFPVSSPEDSLLDGIEVEFIRPSETYPF